MDLWAVAWWKKSCFFFSILRTEANPLLLDLRLDRLSKSKSKIQPDILRCPIVYKVGALSLVLLLTNYYRVHVYHFAGVVPTCEVTLKRHVKTADKESFNYYIAVTSEVVMESPSLESLALCLPRWTMPCFHWATWHCSVYFGFPFSPIPL